ncbi:MAG: dihydrolipoamide acetyltransferase family protein [Planctomycetota bacterium]
MAFEFKLPDLGEGVAEGEIIEWKVAVGDTVEEDTALVEVMTDKATVEIPSPQAGTIKEIRHEAGAVVPVGEVLVVIEGGGESATPAAAAPAEATPQVQAEVKLAPPASGASAPVAAPAPRAAAPAANSASVLAAPATRKLARELGVDLSAAQGSGPRGRVTKDDVRALVGTSPQATPTAGASAPVTRPEGSRQTITPYRGLRKKIGDQMVASAFSKPHFTLVEEIDMTAVNDLRKTYKETAAERGVKLTFLPFIMKALIAALKHHPALNAILDEQAGEIITYDDVHLGFALDTDRGLMVPVIHDANRKNMYELAGDLGRLSGAGRDGSISREEMSGSTITITSAGSIGGLFATPIINHPEVAILGIYRIEDRPVVVAGDVVVRKMMYMSITLDHRIVDGGEAARFMNTMKRLLGDPRTMLMEA